MISVDYQGEERIYQQLQKKISLHWTDGGFFTTDVCAKFKVMWRKKTRPIIRNPAGANLDIVP